MCLPVPCGLSLQRPLHQPLPFSPHGRRSRRRPPDGPRVGSLEHAILCVHTSWPNAEALHPRRPESFIGTTGDRSWFTGQNASCIYDYIGYQKKRRWCGWCCRSASRAEAAGCLACPSDSPGRRVFFQQWNYGKKQDGPGVLRATVRRLRPHSMELPKRQAFDASGFDIDVSTRTNPCSTLPTDNECPVCSRATRPKGGSYMAGRSAGARARAGASLEIRRAWTIPTPC